MNSDQANTLLDKVCADFIDDCPHCGARAHLVMIANEHHFAKNRDQYNYVLFRCKPCRRITLEVHKFRQNPYSDEEKLESDGWIAKYPSTKTEASEEFSSSVPKLVIEDYEEGLRSLSANSPKAAASMFRRALQNSLIELGADQKAELIDQIKLVERLTQDIKDWAHNIRIFGNWGAHPQSDLLKNVDIKKAEEVKEFIEEFFNYVYVMPAKVAAARKAYEKPAKKAATK